MLSFSQSYGSCPFVATIFVAMLLADQTPRKSHRRVEHEISEPPGEGRRYLKQERLEFDETHVRALAERIPERQVVSSEAVALRTLAIAEAYANAGVCRRTARPQITRFCRLFGLGFMLGGSPTRFCAAGVSYSGCQAIVDTELGYDKSRRDDPDYLATLLASLRKSNFYPSPSCQMMLEKAKEEGRFLPPSEAERIKPGYLVLYHWDRKSPIADHVGIVRNDFAARKSGKIIGINTVEFNTVRPGTHGSEADGGAVALKRRDPLGCVLAFVKTY